MEPKSARRKGAVVNRILWVEDNRDNREFLAMFLDMAGYVVTSCDSVRQAAKVARRRQFDIYILGDCLPYGCNLPLAAEISALNAGAPLILYSALAFASDIERGLKAGAHAYITKPGNLDYLLATINGLLRGSDPRQAEPGGAGRTDRRCDAGRSLTRTVGDCVADPGISNRIMRALRSGAPVKPATGRNQPRNSVFTPCLNSVQKN